MLHPEVLWIALAAFTGGLLSGLVGWATSTEKFNFRKFLVTVITAFIAGIGFALTYQISADKVAWPDILAAVFAGAGGDALINRIGKWQAFQSKPPPK